MEKLIAKFEQKLNPIARFFGRQRHLLAIRDGIMSVIPMTIIGSIFLIIACPPVDPQNLYGVEFIDNFLMKWYDWAQANAAMIKAPFNATMGIMALFIVGATAYSLAKSYKKDPLNYSICATSIFILITSPITEGVISVQYFDSKGILMAVFTAICTVEIMRFVDNKGWTIKMPKGVPPVVEKSFRTLIPFTIALVGIYMLSVIVQFVTGKLIPELWYSIFTSFKTGVTNAAVVSILTGIENLLFAFGVHPTTVVGPVLDPIQLVNITANSVSYAAGQVPIEIYTEPFTSFYSALGGAGATLGLAFLLIKSKSKHMREVGKVGLIPCLFNINEPLIFGLPIFMNPVLIIPFMLAPAVNIILGFFVHSAGLVNNAVVNGPWTAPAPIGAMISSLDWRAFVFVCILIVIDMMIWYPFAKYYEKNMLVTEMGSDEETELATQ